MGLGYLRSMLPDLKNESAYLYRYNSFSSFDLKFKKMTNANQARLLYIAYTEGDKDIAFVANRLKNISEIKFNEINELLVNFSTEEIEVLADDNEEIKYIDKNELSSDEKERICFELKKACKLMGNLHVENAYWVILYPDVEESTLWIPASEGYRAGSINIYFSDHVYSKMSDEEKCNLIDQMKKAAFVLHLHNHPPFSPVLPSKEDRSFSAYWKGIDPLFQTGIMRFFIIQENVAIEYTQTSQRWLGMLNNDMINGKEYYVFDDGKKYLGEWNNSKMHGYGQLIMSETKKYEGLFCDGIMEGNGVLVDGQSRYEGTFLNGLFSGNGTMYYTESWHYSGQWVGGCRHGEGKEVIRTKYVYSGAWKNDKKHGHGMEQQITGEKYTGEWSKGKKHGHGVEQLKTGEKYIGEWNCGKKVGKGIYITSDGKEIKGMWIEKIEYTDDADDGLKRKRDFVKDRPIMKTIIGLPEAFLR